MSLLWVSFPTAGNSGTSQHHAATRVPVDCGGTFQELCDSAARPSGGRAPERMAGAPPPTSSSLKAGGLGRRKHTPQTDSPGQAQAPKRQPSELCQLRLGVACSALAPLRRACASQAGVARPRRGGAREGRRRGRRAYRARGQHRRDHFLAGAGFSITPMPGMVWHLGHTHTRVEGRSAIVERRRSARR